MAEQDEALKLAMFALKGAISDRDWDATEAAFNAVLVILDPEQATEG